MPPKTSTCRSFNNESVVRDDAPRLLYTRKEAARQLSISLRSIDYLISSGSIRVRRIGGRVLITRKELERFAADDRSDGLAAA